MPGHKHFMLYDPPRLRKGMKGLSDADDDDDLEDKHVGWYDLFFDLCLVTGTFSFFISSLTKSRTASMTISSVAISSLTCEPMFPVSKRSIAIYHPRGQPI